MVSMCNGKLLNFFGKTEQILNHTLFWNCTKIIKDLTRAPNHANSIDYKLVS
jgi:hypothetical protein